MDNDRIKFIFKNDLGLEIDSIIDSSKGVDHKVYIISCKNKKYIFRESVKNKNTLYNINFVLNKLKSKKVPNILIYNKNYLIETFIFGEELDKFNKNKLSITEIKEVYFKLGQLLKELHSIKSDCFSKWGTKIDKSNKKHFYMSVYLYFYNNLKKHIDQNNFTKNEISKIKDYFVFNNKFLKDIKQFSLINEDISEKHILIYKNNFSGLIDFGDSSFSDPLIDFRYLYKFKYDYKMKSLEKGYGRKVDFKKVEFYKFLDGIGGIIWTKDNNFFKESKGIKKMILNYIK